MMSLVVILCLVIDPTAAPKAITTPVPPALGQALAQRLDGDWAIQRVIIDGRALPDQLIRNSHFTFQGDTLISSMGEHRILFDVILDTTVQPARIDVHRTTIDGITQRKLGIFAIHGNRLVYCYHPTMDEESARPTTFESERGSGIHIIEMVRVQPEPDTP